MCTSTRLVAVLLMVLTPYHCPCCSAGHKHWRGAWVPLAVPVLQLQPTLPLLESWVPLAVPVLKLQPGLPQHCLRLICPLAMAILFLSCPHLQFVTYGSLCHCSSAKDTIS
jgi:hypothetical protein